MTTSIPASMRLQNLQSEPKRLLSEADRLNEELDSLVMDNYRVFIDNLTCSVFLRTEDKKISECSSELGKDLTTFGQQCHLFRDRVGNYISAHKRNRKTLKHNMQLVELLEIPQLVDACSRNGFYDEAMELAIFVNGLERKHILASEVRIHSSAAPSPSATTTNGGYGVVKSIVDDVHTTLVELRKQLLMQLSEESSLPKLLQTLGVLRKLDSILIDRQLEDEKHSNFSSLLHSEKSFELVRKNLLKRVETTLQMNFLEARSVWMERCIREVLQGNTAHDRPTRSAEGIVMSKRQLHDDAAAGEDPVLGPYGRGIELLEICRSSWYAVVTQYNALFADCVAEYSSRSLLAFWLENQLNILEEELKDLLANIDEGPSVRSLIEQCYSFSERMSQVGCDFSDRIIPIFEEVVRTRIGNTWTRGLSSFKQMVEMEKFMVEVEEGMVEHVIPLYLRQDQEQEGETDGSSAVTSSSLSGLMSYPPLAYLLNSFLIGMNFLRDCPLLSLRDQLLTIFKQVLRDLCNFMVLSSDDIKSKGKKFILESTTGSPGDINKPGTAHTMDTKTVSYEENMDKVYAVQIMDEVIPHCLECFKIIFSSIPSTTPTSLDSTDDLVKKSNEQFVGNIKDIEEKCREILVSGSLVNVKVNLPPASSVTSAISKPSIEPMKATSAPISEM